jgi:hypothetical protein
MKAKYLIQVYTSNPSLTASPFGFFTISGKMTKKAAVEELAEFKALNEQRAMRVISQKDFQAEIREANQKAYLASK